MAIVRKISHRFLERNAPHTEVQCTYDVVIAKDSKKYLQLDTYGSPSRYIKDKKSQSIRLAPEAIEELRHIFSKHQL